MRAAALAIVLAVVALTTPAGAQGHDFTVTIPVTVSGLPANITQMGFECYVYPEDYTNPANQIANGGVRISVSRSYSGNAVITFNAMPGKDPSLARWYRCTGQFYGTDDRGREVAYFAGGQNVGTVFPLVASAPFTLGYNAARMWTRIPGR